jgi:hypothetical protein
MIPSSHETAVHQVVQHTGQQFHSIHVRYTVANLWETVIVYVYSFLLLLAVV